MQQFALRKPVSRHFAIVGFFTEESSMSPPCSPCSSSSIFFHFLQKVPPAKAAQAVVAPVQYFAEAKSAQVCSLAWLTRFELLLVGPSPVQVPHSLNSNAMCWRASQPLLNPSAIHRHSLGCFLKHQCLGPCHSAWSQQPTCSNSFFASVWELLFCSAILKLICDHI